MIDAGTLILYCALALIALNTALIALAVYTEKVRKDVIGEGRD